METPAEPPSPPASPKSPVRVKLTAEERLFQVIENGGAPPDKGGEGILAKIQKILRLPQILRSLEKFSPLKIWEEVRQRARLRGGLQLANRVLMVLMGIGLLTALLNTFLFKPDLGRVYSRVAQANVPSGNAYAVTPQRPVEDYLGAITGRSLFQPGAKVETKTAAAIPSTGSDEVLGNLQLVGIAWGAYPEAMIRDKKEGRTHFLQQGQKFRDILVKEILKDRVIVEYGGQPKELM